MKKTCTMCKKSLSVSYFYGDPKSKDRLKYSCKKCLSIYAAKTYIKYKEKRKIYFTRYNLEKRDFRSKQASEKYKKIVYELFNLLGSKCKRCGFKDKRVLQLDHIKGGGNKERKLYGSGYFQYQRVIEKIKKGSKDFQVLCANCNLIEGIEKGYKKSIWK